MSDQLRPVRLPPGEELPFARAVSRHFHEDRPDEELGAWAGVVADEHFRAWAVRDRGEIVANYGIHTMGVSVPGGHLPAAGVTVVGVAQTHRRRGLLNAMMREALDDAVARGEPVALLYASESPIYGRYGFGVVAPAVEHRVERGVAFHRPGPSGLVEPAGVDEALAQWPVVLRRLQALRPGVVDRPEPLWRMTLAQDPPSGREGASARRLVHVPGRGYASYRVTGDYRDQLPDGEVRLLELVATDPEAEAALWQHVCDIDLTVRVLAPLRPVDDALPELITDRLRARTRVAPPLYARLLDVTAAFEGRTYAAPGRVTLAVADPFGDQSGTYRLEVSPPRATMRRVSEEPELSLPIDALAGVWLAGLGAERLRAGRRVTELVAGAAARLDRIVATDRAAWNPFEF